MRAGWAVKCASLVACGLLLYVLDIGLHISIASKYLTMQGCHRGVSHTFVDFKLDDLIDLDELTLAVSSNASQLSSEASSQDIESRLSTFLENSFYLHLRDKIIRILPQHWINRIVKIISFQATKYRGSDIAKMCKLNGNAYPSLAEMALYVCDLSLKSNKHNEEATRATRALTAMLDDDATEDALVEAMVKFDVQKIMNILITDILAGGDLKLAKVLEEVFYRVSSTFTNAEDVSVIIDLISDELIQKHIGELTNILSNIDPKYLEGTAKTFAKIDPNNLPKIDKLLGKLNVTLATFIMDPGVLFTFFGDPEKAKVMMEVQQLLPIFTPEDIEGVLNVKLAFDPIPDSDKIFAKVLSLPGSVLKKIFQVNFSPEELEALKKAADRFIEDEDTLVLVGLAIKDLDLLSPAGRKAFVAGCKHEALKVECVDTSVDLCSQGHFLYGLCTIACVALPGILFGLSDFVSQKGFTFGRAKKTPKLKEWPMVVKLLVLPFYLVFMVPFVIIITVVNYVKSVIGLITTNQTRNLSAASIYNASTSSEEDTQAKREREFDTVKFHSLESHGESFFQVITQVYFLFLLLILGTGTVIAGVSAETFFQDIFPLTVASILTSLVNFMVTSWRLQAKDHIAKDASDPRSNQFKHMSHQGFVESMTHILWTSTSILIYAGSLVTMSLLGYIEMFSSYLTETGFKADIHLLPFLIIISTIPVNIVLYYSYVDNGDSHSLAHAILSSISPCRYLHRENVNKTRRFLIGNQVTKWLSHILAWLAYSIAMFANNDKEETGLLRLFPVLTALVTIPPLFGAIHWAVAIEPSYANAIQNEKEQPESIVSLRGQTSKLQIIWQILTLITRCVSMALLAFVYYEHWLEVGWSSVRLAVVETIPFMVVLMLGNVAIQFVYHFGSLFEGLVGIFMPNGYLKAQLQFMQDSDGKKNRCPVKMASHYIVMNVIWNATVHILLWVVLSFYCWECTKVLSLNKLIYCFPIAIFIWVLNFLLTIFVWRKSIRPILAAVEPVRMVQEKDTTANAATESKWESEKAFSTNL